MPTFDFDEFTGDTATLGFGASDTEITASTSLATTDGGVNFTVSSSITATGFNVSGTASVFVSDIAGAGLSAGLSIISSDPASTVEYKLTISFSTTSNATTWSVTGINGVFNGGALNLSTALVTSNAIMFSFSTNSTNGDFMITSLSANITCYCAGTRIATPDGFKEVQDLVPGDRLRLADGGETVVHWLGRQSVSKTFADPRRVNPICVRAGAFGNTRDLYVSPDHGIAIDGYLINASALVNGETITQVAEMPGDFMYYHVETEAHEVILAEGIPTESYVDLPSRAVFDNGHERMDAPRIEPMQMPRISSARLVPPAIRAARAPRIAA